MYRTAKNTTSNEKSHLTQSRPHYCRFKSEGPEQKNVARRSRTIVDAVEDAVSGSVDGQTSHASTWEPSRNFVDTDGTINEHLQRFLL